MNRIPSEHTLDSSLSLLKDGYQFIQKRSQRYQSDLFQTHVLLEKAVCLHGAEAAQVFYDTERFERKKATPSRIQKSLFGQRGVQGLDDASHRHRKEMFMSLMMPDKIQPLLDEFGRQWQRAIPAWETMDRVILFEEAQKILCRAACHWAGVPLMESEVPYRAQDLIALVDAFGAVGPRHWRGRLARKRGEQWTSRIITQIRNQTLRPEEGTAAHTIAWHRDLQGELLPAPVAAVEELLNILRPIVAITWYITFLALALHRYPGFRPQILANEHNFAESFVQEVRRFYPFTPLLGARVRSPFDWRGYHFEEGQLVLLDVYGTNHDARMWENPDVFLPQRFRDWEGNPYTLIPQGGGDHLQNHRCAGEWITIEVMKVALNCLTRAMEYQVPDQDLSYSLRRMPSMIKSGFIISQVRRKD